MIETKKIYEFIYFCKIGNLEEVKKKIKRMDHKEIHYNNDEAFRGAPPPLGKVVNTEEWKL